MTWEQVRDNLTGHRFDIDRSGGLGKRDWVLRPAEGDNCALTFTTLGAGTNKMAVQVNGTSWVLLFGKTGRTVEKDGFREEVETLQALSGRGLRVPAPLDGGQAVYLFEIMVWDDGNEPTVPAFLQAFMSRDDFVEMTKTTPRERDDFAKNNIVFGGRVPPSIDTTLTDLRRIRAEMDGSPWGDFQVMYQKSTGYLYVFDPLRIDPNKQAYLTSIDAWLRDIEQARESSARLQKEVEDIKAKNAVGGQRRRHSIGGGGKGDFVNRGGRVSGTF